MNLQTTVSALFALVAGSALFFGACSDNNTDDCPATITNGDTCTSTDLQCPSSVTVCDGTTVASSCTCTKETASTGGSTWVCGDPGACEDSSTPADDGGDETSTDDGSTDDGSADAPDDTSVADAADTSTPPSLSYFCGPLDASVSSCGACTGRTQPCAYCNNVDAATLTGLCTPFQTNCFNTVPNGFQDCQCASAAACPESYQVCTGAGRCHTCSDVNTNNTLACEGSGTTCNYADGGCY